MDEQSKVENYLINLGITFEQIDSTSWVINDEEKGLEQVAVISAEPLVVIRVNVMDVPNSDREAFFLALLELNAADLIHGAYAIENGEALLVDSLEYGTMDIEEFQASLDAIGLALAQHYEQLSAYRKSE
jgi:hypothetical protein